MCQYCKDTGHEIDNCKHLQYKEDLLAGKKSGRGQTRGSDIGVGLRVGATSKNDPMISSSLDSQLDDNMLKTLVNSASITGNKTTCNAKGCVRLSQGYLECHGKGGSFSP